MPGEDIPFHNLRRGPAARDSPVVKRRGSQGQNSPNVNLFTDSASDESLTQQQQENATMALSDSLLASESSGLYVSSATESEILTASQENDSNVTINENAIPSEDIGGNSDEEKIRDTSDDSVSSQKSKSFKEALLSQPTTTAGQPSSVVTPVDLNLKDPLSPIMKYKKRTIPADDHRLPQKQMTGQYADDNTKIRSSSSSDADKSFCTAKQSKGAPKDRKDTERKKRSDSGSTTSTKTSKKSKSRGKPKDSDSTGSRSREESELSASESEDSSGKQRARYRTTVLTPERLLQQQRLALLLPEITRNFPTSYRAKDNSCLTEDEEAERLDVTAAEWYLKRSTYFYDELQTNAAVIVTMGLILSQLIVQVVQHNDGEYLETASKKLNISFEDLNDATRLHNVILAYPHLIPLIANDEKGLMHQFVRHIRIDHREMYHIFHKNYKVVCEAEYLMYFLFVYVENLIEESIKSDDTRVEDEGDKNDTIDLNDTVRNSDSGLQHLLADSSESSTSMEISEHIVEYELVRKTEWGISDEDASDREPITAQLQYREPITAQLQESKGIWQVKQTYTHPNTIPVIQTMKQTTNTTKVEGRSTPRKTPPKRIDQPTVIINTIKAKDDRQDVDAEGEEKRRLFAELEKARREATERQRYEEECRLERERTKELVQELKQQLAAQQEIEDLRNELKQLAEMQAIHDQKIKVEKEQREKDEAERLALQRELTKRREIEEKLRESEEKSKQEARVLLERAEMTQRIQQEPFLSQSSSNRQEDSIESESTGEQRQSYSQDVRQVHGTDDTATRQAENVPGSPTNLKYSQSSDTKQVLFPNFFPTVNSSVSNVTTSTTTTTPSNQFVAPAIPPRNTFTHPFIPGKYGKGTNNGNNNNNSNNNNNRDKNLKDSLNYAQRDVQQDGASYGGWNQQTTAHNSAQELLGNSSAIADPHLQPIVLPNPGNYSFHPGAPNEHNTHGSNISKPNAKQKTSGKKTLIKAGTTPVVGTIPLIPSVVIMKQQSKTETAPATNVTTTVNGETGSKEKKIINDNKSTNNDINPSTPQQNANSKSSLKHRVMEVGYAFECIRDSPIRKQFKIEERFFNTIVANRDEMMQHFLEEFCKRHNDSLSIISELDEILNSDKERVGRTITEIDNDGELGQYFGGGRMLVSILSRKGGIIDAAICFVWCAIQKLQERRVQKYLNPQQGDLVYEISQKMELQNNNEVLSSDEALEILNECQEEYSEDEESGPVIMKQGNSIIKFENYEIFRQATDSTQDSEYKSLLKSVMNSGSTNNQSNQGSMQMGDNNRRVNINSNNGTGDKDKPISNVAKTPQSTINDKKDETTKSIKGVTVKKKEDLFSSLEKVRNGKAEENNRRSVFSYLGTTFIECGDGTVKRLLGSIQAVGGKFTEGHPDNNGHYWGLNNEPLQQQGPVAGSLEEGSLMKRHELFMEGEKGYKSRGSRNMQARAEEVLRIKLVDVLSTEYDKNGYGIVNQPRLQPDQEMEVLVTTQCYLFSTENEKVTTTTKETQINSPLMKNQSSSRVFPAVNSHKRYTVDGSSEKACQLAVNSIFNNIQAMYGKQTYTNHKVVIPDLESERDLHFKNMTKIVEKEPGWRNYKSDSNLILHADTENYLFASKSARLEFVKAKYTTKFYVRFTWIPEEESDLPIALDLRQDDMDLNGRYAGLNTTYTTHDWLVIRFIFRQWDIIQNLSDFQCEGWSRLMPDADLLVRPPSSSPKRNVIQTLRGMGIDIKFIETQHVIDSLLVRPDLDRKNNDRLMSPFTISRETRRLWLVGGREWYTRCQYDSGQEFNIILMTLNPNEPIRNFDVKDISSFMRNLTQPLCSCCNETDCGLTINENEFGHTQRCDESIRVPTERRFIHGTLCYKERLHRLQLELKNKRVFSEGINRSIDPIDQYFLHTLIDYENEITSNDFYENFSSIWRRYRINNDLIYNRKYEELHTHSEQISIGNGERIEVTTSGEGLLSVIFNKIYDGTPQNQQNYVEEVENQRLITRIWWNRISEPHEISEIASNLTDPSQSVASKVSNVTDRLVEERKIVELNNKVRKLEEQNQILRSTPPTPTANNTPTSGINVDRPVASTIEKIYRYDEKSNVGPFSDPNGEVIRMLSGPFSDPMKGIVTLENNWTLIESGGVKFEYKPQGVRELSEVKFREYHEKCIWSFISVTNLRNQSDSEFTVACLYRNLQRMLNESIEKHESEFFGTRLMILENYRRNNDLYIRVDQENIKTFKWNYTNNPMQLTSALYDDRNRGIVELLCKFSPKSALPNSINKDSVQVLLSPVNQESSKKEPEQTPIEQEQTPINKATETKEAILRRGERERQIVEWVHEIIKEGDENEELKRASAYWTLSKIDLNSDLPDAKFIRLIPNPRLILSNKLTKFELWSEQYKEETSNLYYLKVIDQEPPAEIQPQENIPAAIIQPPNNIPEINTGDVQPITNNLVKWDSVKDQYGMRSSMERVIEKNGYKNMAERLSRPADLTDDMKEHFKEKAKRDEAKGITIPDLVDENWSGFSMNNSNQDRVPATQFTTPTTVKSKGSNPQVKEKTITESWKSREGQLYYLDKFDKTLHDIEIFYLEELEKLNSNKNTTSKGRDRPPTTIKWFDWKVHNKNFDKDSMELYRDLIYSKSEGEFSVCLKIRRWIDLYWRQFCKINKSRVCDEDGLFRYRTGMGIMPKVGVVRWAGNATVRDKRYMTAFPLDDGRFVQIDGNPALEEGIRENGEKIRASIWDYCNSDRRHVELNTIAYFNSEQLFLVDKGTVLDDEMLLDYTSSYESFILPDLKEVKRELQMLHTYAEAIVENNDLRKQLIYQMTTDFTILSLQMIIDKLSQAIRIMERDLTPGEIITKGERMIMNKFKQIYDGIYTSTIFPNKLTPPETMEYRLWQMSRHGSDPSELQEAWGTVIFTILTTILTGHMSQNLPFFRAYIFRDEFIMPELYTEKGDNYNPILTYPIPILFTKKYQNSVDKTVRTSEFDGYHRVYDIFVYSDTKSIFDNISKSESFLGLVDPVIYDKYCRDMAQLKSRGIAGESEEIIRRDYQTIRNDVVKLMLQTHGRKDFKIVEDILNLQDQINGIVSSSTKFTRPIIKKSIKKEEDAKKSKKKEKKKKKKRTSSSGAGDPNDEDPEDSDDNDNNDNHNSRDYSSDRDQNDRERDFEDNEDEDNEGQDDQDRGEKDDNDSTSNYTEKKPSKRSNSTPNSPAKSKEDKSSVNFNAIFPVFPDKKLASDDQRTFNEDEWNGEQIFKGINPQDLPSNWSTTETAKKSYYYDINYREKFFKRVAQINFNGHNCKEALILFTTIYADSEKISHLEAGEALHEGKWIAEPLKESWANHLKSLKLKFEDKIKKPLRGEDKREYWQNVTDWMVLLMLIALQNWHTVSLSVETYYTQLTQTKYRGISIEGSKEGEGLQNYTEKLSIIYSKLEKQDRSQERIMNIIKAELLKTITSSNITIYQDVLNELYSRDAQYPKTFEKFLDISRILKRQVERTEIQSQTIRAEVRENNQYNHKSQNQPQISKFFHTKGFQIPLNDNSRKSPTNKIHSLSAKEYQNNIQENINRQIDQLDNLSINNTGPSELDRDINLLLTEESRILEAIEGGSYMENESIVKLFSIVQSGSINDVSEGGIVLERKDDWNMCLLHSALVQNRVAMQALEDGELMIIDSVAMSSETQAIVNDYIVKNIKSIFGGDISTSKFGAVLTLNLPQTVTRDMYSSNKNKTDPSAPCSNCGRPRHTHNTCVMMSTDGKLSVIALLVQPELMRKSWYRTCCQYGILSKLSEDDQKELWNTINTIRGSISQEYLDTVNDFFRSQMMQILADNEKAKQEREGHYGASPSAQKSGYNSNYSNNNNYNRGGGNFSPKPAYQQKSTYQTNLKLSLVQTREQPATMYESVTQSGQKSKVSIVQAQFSTTDNSDSVKINSASIAKEVKDSTGKPWPVEIAGEREVNNDALMFVKMSLYPPSETFVKKFMDMQEQGKFLIENIAYDLNTGENIRTIVIDSKQFKDMYQVLLDNGAFASIIDEEEAMRLNLPILHKAVIKKASGAVGQATESISKIALAITVMEDATSVETGERVRLAFMTQLQVMKGFDSKLLVGAQQFIDLDAVTHHKDGYITLLKGKDMVKIRACNRNQMQWKIKDQLFENDEGNDKIDKAKRELALKAMRIEEIPMEAHLEANLLRINSMRINSTRVIVTKVEENDTVEKPAVMTDKDKSKENVLSWNHWMKLWSTDPKEEMKDNMKQARNAIYNPKSYFNIFDGTKRMAVIILILILLHLQIPGVSSRLQTVDKHLRSRVNKQVMTTPEEWAVSLSESKKLKEGIEDLKLLAETYSNARHWDLNSEKIPIEYSVAGDDIFLKAYQTIAGEDINELIQAESEVKEFQKRNCRDLMLEEKPDQFPLEFWKFVPDLEKVKVKERWSKFTTERLDQVIKIMTEVLTISKETPARALQEPIFRAQALANLDSFAHPNPDNPPFMKSDPFKINLITGAIPVRAERRKWDVFKRASAYRRLEKMEENGRMDTDSKSEWSSPVMMVPYAERIQAFIDKHKDNIIEALWDVNNAAEVIDLFRFTGDFRGLNEQTLLENFPLHYISDLLDEVKNSDRYSIFDLEDAFFTIMMEENSRAYTAFQTPDVHAQYNCMAQGLKSAANFFARVVYKIFKDARRVKRMDFFVFQDDISEHAKDFAKHHSELSEIYSICREHRMILKVKKSFINFMEIRILGHLMSKYGRAPDPNLVKSITNIARPTDLTGIKSICGLAQVSREYTHLLSRLIEPIQRLNRQNVDVVKEWGPEQDECLENLKMAITSKPILMMPDMSKPFTIAVDACRVGRGIGAVLLQKDSNGMERPVAYFSRSLTEAERNYSATDLEATGLHDALLHWEKYMLNGHKDNLIRTDHYALLRIICGTSSAAQKQRMSHIISDIQHFYFSLEHRAGKNNIPADAVSRLLQWGEKPYIYTREMLQDDTGPLSEEEKQRYRILFKRDANYLIDIAEDYSKAIQKKIEENPTVDKKKIIQELNVDMVSVLVDKEEEEFLQIRSVLMNFIKFYDEETEYRRGKGQEQFWNHINEVNVDSYTEERVIIHKIRLENKDIFEGDANMNRYLQNEDRIKRISDNWKIPRFVIAQIMDETMENDQEFNSDETSEILNQVTKAYQRFERLNKDSEFYEDKRLTRIPEMSTLALKIIAESELITDNIRTMINGQLMQNKKGLRFKINGNREMPDWTDVKMDTLQRLNIFQLRECAMKLESLTHLQKFSTQWEHWNEEFVRELQQQLFKRSKMGIPADKGEITLDIKSISTDRLVQLESSKAVIEEVQLRENRKYSVEQRQLLTVSNLLIFKIIPEGDSEQEQQERNKILQEIQSDKEMIRASGILSGILSDNTTRKPRSTEQQTRDHLIPEELRISKTLTNPENTVIINMTRVRKASSKAQQLEEESKKKELEKKMRKQKEINRKKFKRSKNKKSNESKEVRENVKKEIKNIMSTNEELRTSGNAARSKITKDQEGPKLVEGSKAKESKRIEKERLQMMEEKLEISNNDNQPNISTKQKKIRAKLKAGRFADMTADQLESYNEPQNHAEEIKEELINIQLEEYDHLTRQRYVDEEEQLRQIISVRHDKTTQKFVTIARAIKDNGEIINDICMERRDIEGENGTMQLVDLHGGTTIMKDIVKVPSSYNEWVLEQSKDATLLLLLEKLKDGKAIDVFKLKTSGQESYMEEDDADKENSKGKRFDIIYRKKLILEGPTDKPIEEKKIDEEIIDEEEEELDDNSMLMNSSTQQDPIIEVELGPLVRRFNRVKVISLGNVTINKMEEMEQIIVPQHMRKSIIKLYHDKFGHQGNRRTLANIKKKYYWSTMRKDIQDHVNNCHFCKCRKAHNLIARVPVQKYEIINRPWDQTHSDSTGPWNMTRLGNKWLLILRDRLTKFIILIPMKDKNATETTDNLNDTFLTFGFPRKLITDRGKEFSLKNLGPLLRQKRSDGQHKRISPLAPRANGEAENAMRYIKDILAAYINKYQDNWDIYIKEIQSIMNSFVSDATGYTPNFLLFGRELANADETYFQQKAKGKTSEYREVMEYIWNEVATKLSTINVDKFNKPVKEPLEFKPYKVGEFVFVKRVPRKCYKTRNEEEKYVSSRKLQHRYSGPFMILEKKSDVSYMLDIHGKSRPMHAINIKPV